MVVNAAIEKNIDETNRFIDHEIDEIDDGTKSVVQDVSSAVSFKNVADALMEDQNEKNPFDKVNDEVAKREERERMERERMQEEANRESSFEQAVKEQNMRLQTEAEKRGMARKNPQREEEFVR